MSRLEEIRKRAEKATPGLWKWDSGNWEVETRSDKHFRSAICSMAPSDRGTIDGEVNGWSHDATPDGEFIAHAREDIPFLLERLERAEAKIKEISEGRHCSACSCNCHYEASAYFEANSLPQDPRSE